MLGRLAGMFLTNDQKKLLYLIGQYTTSRAAVQPAPSPKKTQVDRFKKYVQPDEKEASPDTVKQRWIKEHSLNILVYHGIKEGLFENYAYSPTLMAYHGVRLFANLSQEAYFDLRYLRRTGFIIKLKLSTVYYDDTGAFRLTEKGRVVMNETDARTRKRIDGIYKCDRCKAYMDVRLERLEDSSDKITLNAVEECNRCCDKCTEGEEECKQCQWKRSLDFFKIEPVQYASRPYLPEATR